MELSLKILLESILLLDEESIRKALTIHRQALDLACKKKLIFPAVFKEYSDLKKRVTNSEDQTTMTKNNSSETETKATADRLYKKIVEGSVEESKERFQNFIKRGPLDKHELQCLFDQNDLIKKNRWSKWVLMFFLPVPKDKYISRQHINEVLESWGYRKNKRPGEEDMYVRQSTLMSRLSDLVRDGYLEKENLLDERYEGKEGFLCLRDFCEKNVHGSFKVNDSRTQSVFRLTDEGVHRALYLKSCFGYGYHPKNSGSTFEKFGVLALGPGACPPVETFLTDSYYKSGLILPNARNLIRRIKPTKRSTVLNLVSVNENDLGLGVLGDSHLIFDRAIELGLQACPDDTAFVLLYHQYNGIKEEPVRIIIPDLESCFVLWRTPSGTVRLAVEDLDDLNHLINLNQ